MTHLPHYKILDWKMDFLPRQQLLDLQSERLANMARYVYAHTAFWRRKFDEAGITPADIKSVADIGRIPFCHKSELQEDQAQHPPFGSYVATPSSHWIKMTATSGTTGRPLKRVYSARDWSYMLDRFQRNPQIGPGDVVMIMGPTDGLIGPTLAAASAERAGAMVIYAGRYRTQQRIELLLEFKPKTVSATATYLLHLAEVAAGQGIDLRDAGVKVLQSVGEPGAAVEATRKRLADAWGAQVLDGFGLTEIFPLGGSRPHSTDIHIASDMALIEVLDPDTGQPVAQGEAGELVVTNLISDTQPLLRYRTGDLVRLAEGDTGSDGYSGARLAGGILGRIDDMIWFRGANIYPSAIEQVVRGMPVLGSEFQIVLTGSGALPNMTVRVEPRDDATIVDAEAQAALRNALTSAIRVSVDVEAVSYGVLPRIEDRGKSRRVIDQRS